MKRLSDGVLLGPARALRCLSTAWQAAKITTPTKAPVCDAITPPMASASMEIAGQKKRRSWNASICPIAVELANSVDSRRYPTG